MNINSGNNFRSIMSSQSVAGHNSAKKTGTVGKTGSAGFSEIMSRTFSDSIQIGARKTMSDDEFVKSLGAKLSNEVRAGNSMSDINSVKQQIALGEYDINPSEIAKKILG